MHKYDVKITNFVFKSKLGMLKKLKEVFIKS